MPKQQHKLKFEISIERVYKTDLNSIQYIAICSDGSMWMGDATRSKLQHVKCKENKTKVITSLNTEVFGIAKNHSNNFLVATNSTKLKLINTMTGQITDSMYDVKPFTPTSVHVTNDHRVMIGAVTPANHVPATGRRVVIVLDQNGKQLSEYELDNHNKHLFALPIFITSTSHGNICVVDWSDTDDRGRIIVFAPGGDILGNYTGHPDVNTEKDPFKPVGILTTPSDNIVVTDLNNHHLHILTNIGQSITYYNLYDIGIIYPISLALSTSGTIYLGCVNKLGNAETTKAKLYELYYSGF
ncbi:TRIM71 [Mytilus coruscus]|uniref:TRIM71 n=1 Tax=Mytilus coruscus TaxID=42192 RepID=A0A6J8AA48_MYTCO|nr:TRIM71 [Mytilus coruscus]